MVISILVRESRVDETRERLLAVAKDGISGPDEAVVV